MQRILIVFCTRAFEYADGGGSSQGDWPESADRLSALSLADARTGRGCVREPAFVVPVAVVLPPLAIAAPSSVGIVSCCDRRPCHVGIVLRFSGDSEGGSFVLRVAGFNVRSEPFVLSMSFSSSICSELSCVISSGSRLSTPCLLGDRFQLLILLVGVGRITGLARKFVLWARFASARRRKARSTTFSTTLVNGWTATSRPRTGLNRSSRNCIPPASNWLTAASDSPVTEARYAQRHTGGHRELPDPRPETSLLHRLRSRYPITVLTARIVNMRAWVHRAQRQCLVQIRRSARSCWLGCSRVCYGQ